MSMVIYLDDGIVLNEVGFKVLTIDSCFGRNGLKVFRGVEFRTSYVFNGNILELGRQRGTYFVNCSIMQAS